MEVDVRAAFDEFVRWEHNAGGPDPHMRVAEWIANMTTADPAWFVALYVAVYNVPTAEVLYHHWPSPAMVLEDTAGFRKWVLLSWTYPGLVLRKERRVAGFGPDRLADHIIDLATWFQRGARQRLEEAPDFPTAWEIVKEVRFNGRYFTCKLYEVLRRTTGIPHHKFSDIRPRGGSLARRTLSWLWPHDPYNDSVAGLMEANGFAAIELERHKFLDWFTVEVMLCNFRQAMAGSQYPGRAHDSELGHLRRVEKAWPDVQFQTLKARAQLFPTACLGEFQGWDDRRSELGKVLTDYGYTWTDLLYSWSASKGNLENPVRRPT